MKEEVCEIKCIETDEGFRIEAKGKGIKECCEAFKSGEFSCCNTGRGH